MAIQIDAELAGNDVAAICATVLSHPGFGLCPLRRLTRAAGGGVWVLASEHPLPSRRGVMARLECQGTGWKMVCGPITWNGAVPFAGLAGQSA